MVLQYSYVEIYVTNQRIGTGLSGRPGCSPAERCDAEQVVMAEIDGDNGDCLSLERGHGPCLARHSEIFRLSCVGRSSISSIYSRPSIAFIQL